MKIQLANNDKDINIICNLSNIIWHDAYKNILSNEQINYMLDKFLSLHSIRENINDGYIYKLFLNNENEYIGFTAYKVYDDYLFLSKLYILPTFQGKGYSSIAIKHLLEYKLPIELTVNKYNTNAYNKYLHFGFKVIDSVVTDIGNNYVMDDYVMRKE